MKCFKYGLVGALAITIASLGSVASAVNLFVNPGFEDPITYDGAPFVGSWEGFSGAFSGGTASSANGTVTPRNGLQNLDLKIQNDATAFAGAFQDVAVSAGNDYTFSGWHKLLSGNSGGTEVRIEWRDAVSEISRTPNSVPATSSAYTQFSLTATAPVGATIARAVYAIQSFTGSGDQNVLVDDASFAVVPEPTSMALVGLAGVALLGLRRHSL